MSDVGLTGPGRAHERTVLITGATSGIGLKTARRLAPAYGTVVLHARTSEDAERAVEALVKSGVDPLRPRTAVADFGRLAEVRDLAERIVREHPRLDVLVNNAATVGPRLRIRTQDGYESPSTAAAARPRRPSTRGSSPRRS